MRVFLLILFLIASIFAKSSDDIVLQEIKAHQIISYKKLLSLIDKKREPMLWALSNAELAVAYYQRIKGDKASNIEEQLSTIPALDIYTQKTVL